MVVTPILGQGTHLQRGDGATPTETFTTVANIISEIPFPQLMYDVKEGTSHDSADATKEYYPGLNDPGQLKFTIGYDPSEATHTQLITDATNRDKHNFKIVMTDSSSSVWAFSAYVIGFQPKGPVDGSQYSADVTLQVTGSVTPPA